MLRADEKLLKPFLPALRTESSDAAAALFASVEEAVRETSGAVEELEGMKASAKAKRNLSHRELVQYEYGTAMFRTLAMAGRLARLAGVEGLRVAARQALQERLIGYQRSARLMPVPLSSSTNLQMAAILTTAGSLTDLP
jgi:hypothetical protein